jgi:hypothetical protein
MFDFKTAGAIGRRAYRRAGILGGAVLVAALLGAAAFGNPKAQTTAPIERAALAAPVDSTSGGGGLQAVLDVETDIQALASIHQGRHTFRYDTFGDEAFWGQKLLLHQVIAGSANGGVGAGVSPKTALSLGIKVDVNALPDSLRRDLKAGRVNLDDPATTLALLKLNAVVGVTGFFDEQGSIQSLGLQCSFCHSTVDDSFAAGIGHLLDGWPNRDLNPGAIIATSPNLAAFASILGTTADVLRATLNSWGPGKFDAFIILDGQTARPDGGPAATLIPALFDIRGSGLVTWNGYGSLATWLPVVINLELHGQGTLSDSRLKNATQFPVAAANGFSHIVSSPDLGTPKLSSLLAYVESLTAPKAPAGSFDAAAAELGEALFTGKAKCSGCHVPPLNTTPGYNLVPASVIGIDSFQADRSPNQGYRPCILRGLFAQGKGGYFHDGRFATLDDVVNHFNTQFSLGLTDDEHRELVEYLKSL